MENKPSIGDIRDRIIGSVHPDIRVGRPVPLSACRMHKSYLLSKAGLPQDRGSVLMLAVEWLQRNKTHPLCLPTHGVWRHRTARWALYYLLIALILCCPGQSQAFIYFQF